MAADDEENPPSEDRSNTSSNNNIITNNDNSSSSTNSPQDPENAADAINKDDAAADDLDLDMKSSPPPSIPPVSTTIKNRSINSYYSNKVGALHTISLILSVGLILYAHIGLSAVILSSRDPTITSVANGATTTASNTTATTTNNSTNGTATDSGEGEVVVEGGYCSSQQDTSLWTSSNEWTGQAEQSVYCSTVWNGGCFLNVTCVEICFQEEYGYSEECSKCFGLVPICGVTNNCIMVCAADSTSEECRTCTAPCRVELSVCTGFSMNNDTDTNTTRRNLQSSNNADVDDGAAETSSCNEFDVAAIETWYTVYELTFIHSVKDAWIGDAKLLAVIIVLFSGIWPYLKKVIIVIIWYVPTTVERQSATLLWLSRLSKYTLVDVFAVIGLIVGLQLQLKIAGLETITRAEPRFGILAFFLATVWEYFEIELIKAMHDRKMNEGGLSTSGCAGGNSSKPVEIEGNGEKEDGQQRSHPPFSKLLVPLFILSASIGLYIAGAMSQILAFESQDFGSTSVCKRSYNMVTLGNALINEISLTNNPAAGQTWTLFFAYIILSFILPILTHLLQVGYIVGWYRSQKLKLLVDWTSSVWCFACIEVLLIGIFAMEYKFPNLVTKIAGESNSGFINIDTSLGTGFYILIAYSVIAGYLQYFLRTRYLKAARSSSSSEPPPAFAEDRRSSGLSQIS